MFDCPAPQVHWRRSKVLTDLLLHGWPGHQVYVSMRVVVADDPVMCWHVSSGFDLITGHFGHKILRHWDTLGHFGTSLKTLRHQKRSTRHFDTSAVIEEKPGHFDPGQFRWDTAPPVIRLKLRQQFYGAEVSRCRSVLWPKCPAPFDLPGQPRTDGRYGRQCTSAVCSVIRGWRKTSAREAASSFRMWSYYRSPRMWHCYVRYWRQIVLVFPQNLFSYLL